MRILHAGCGSTPLPDWLKGEEVRLDINPALKPDVVASILDMGDVGEFDAVYSAHCLEHLYPHEVVPALSEFWRVLKKGGRAFIIVPDLEDVRPTEDVIYQSEVGPITGLDMYFGHGPSVAVNPHMAHHTGFVQGTLLSAIRRTGFLGGTVVRKQELLELMGIALK